MNLSDDPNVHTRPRSFLAASLIPVAMVALVSCNCAAYLHSRSVEFHVRRNWTGVRPWLWPEDVLGMFLMAWGVVLVMSCVAIYRLRNYKLKSQSRFAVATAFVAIVIDTFLLLGEALNF